MIDYSATGATSGAISADAPVWSRVLLQPLAPDALTPFSASVLVELVNRSWYAYFDRLGFEPAPRVRAARMIDGHPYVNLTLGAEKDALFAGLEPPALRIGGTPRLIARWEKPGLLAGLKTGRGAKRVADLMQALPAEIDAAAAQGKSWLERVRPMRWSQAEILQVMEEIERIGAGIMLPFFAARYNLELAHRRLLALVNGPSAAAQVDAVNRAVGGAADSVEVQIARAAAGGAQTLAAEYGHRGSGEGDLINPRWFEQPPVLPGAGGPGAAQVRQARTAAAPDERPLLALVDARRHKEAQALVQQVRRLLPLQSRALDAVAYVLAGTRVWALAAGNEAMGDGRVQAREDIFFYELEETKQMMTGEWNISDLDAIHATAAQRKARRQEQRRTPAPELLIGEVALSVAAGGLPAAPGQGQGPLVLNATVSPAVGGVIGALQADVGQAPLLAESAGLVLAQGSPIDPIVAAAAALGVPAVYELGAELGALAEGVTITVDGSQGRVTRG